MILDTARKIIAKDGVQGLSIRKITKAIEYSPAIIYHYFSGKDEIVQILMEEEYRKILASVAMVEGEGKSPEEEIKETFTNYINSALQSPEVYLAFMLNDDPNILKRTAVLAEGIAQKSPTMRVLSENIIRGIDTNRFASNDPELTAQIIWTATFGLLIKFMIEKVSKEQKDRLIEQHFKIMFNGILNHKEVSE